MHKKTTLSTHDVPTVMERTERGNLLLREGGERKTVVLLGEEVPQLIHFLRDYWPEHFLLGGIRVDHPLVARVEVLEDWARRVEQRHGMPSL